MIDLSEPLQLRWHRATYPRHLIWGKRNLVTRQRQVERLIRSIKWER